MGGELTSMAGAGSLRVARVDASRRQPARRPAPGSAVRPSPDVLLFPKTPAPAPKAPINHSDIKQGLWDAVAGAVPLAQMVWNAAAGVNGAALMAVKVPKIPGMVAADTRIGDLLDKIELMPAVSRVVESGPFQAVSRFMSRPLIQTAGRMAGRIAPLLSVGFAGFDLFNACRTQANPHATPLRKRLMWLQAGLMSVSAGASIATVALVPTGVGAAVAGGVALLAGLGSAVVGFAMSRVAPE